MHSSAQHVNKKEKNDFPEFLYIGKAPRCGWANPKKENEMTAKQYLSQIRLLDIKINQRIEEAKSLAEIAVGLRSPELKQDVVQTSHDSNPVGNAVIRYLDVQKEIDDLIDRFVDLKHKIIGEIQDMSDPRYSEILYLRYVEYMSFVDIAEAMHYEYKYVCALHGKALKLFNTSRPNTN